MDFWAKKVPESVMGEKICAKKCINHNLSGTNKKERKGPSYNHLTIVSQGSSKNNQN